jgi:DNA-binding Lrp family transcriptional regulator
MDSTDLEIIKALLKDARSPLSELSAKLGISMPAVQKRIEKLKGKGIISGSSIHLNTGIIGWKRAQVLVNVKRSAYDAFLSHAAKLPLVTGIYQATGPYAVLVEFLGPAGVVNAVISHVKGMGGVVDCCAISLAEKVA